VLRDGHAEQIATEEIVPGDVVLLAGGSLIPADGVLLAGTDFFVSQAVLTGESFPVQLRGTLVGMIGVIAVLYVTATEVQKKWFYRGVEESPRRASLEHFPLGGRLSSSDRDNRTGCRRDYAPSDAAEKELRQSAAPMGADDDEVRFRGATRPNDLIGGIAVAEDRCRLDTGFLGSRGEPVEMFRAPFARLPIESVDCGRVDVLVRHSDDWCQDVRDRESCVQRLGHTQCCVERVARSR
jgi:hypothetical protein